MAAEHVKRLGERIRARREELGMTQEEVAREMPGRVSGSRISLWERGENRPRDDSLEHLAAVLQTTVLKLSAPGPDKSATPSLFPANTVEQRLRELEGHISQRMGALEQQLTSQLAAHAEEVRGLLARQSAVLERIEELVLTLPSDAQTEELLQALEDDDQIAQPSERAAEETGRAPRSRRAAG